MDEWVTLMTQEIVPFQTELGLKITAMYRGEDDRIFVWTRDFVLKSLRRRKSDIPLWYLFKFVKLMLPARR